MATGVNKLAVEVADMVMDMEVDMMADMEVDKILRKKITILTKFSHFFTGFHNFDQISQSIATTFHNLTLKLVS